MLEEGCKPQEAAFVLTNSTKAEIHVKGNFREWLHFFSLRDSNSDHIDMKELVHPLHVEVQCLCPTIFGEEEAVGAGT
jgi:thymidylate synthase ThyX